MDSCACAKNGPCQEENSTGSINRSCNMIYMCDDHYIWEFACAIEDLKNNYYYSQIYNSFLTRQEEEVLFHVIRLCAY